eukprot:CAMPEP_0198524168 /NCGR_PEP_ID=MMETSP1462-20131121/22592_1 /TAXON_ID=1333877 /ORGANISM="Brandtodinium nutriculum, Strain RCC3387" /LENGTH=141 /DNA_ID=CAMNT_0044253889 /DNA_START=1 /DNA_END=422 /DNA_ORIENTATION=-
MPGGATIRRVQVDAVKLEESDVISSRNDGRTFNRRVESEAKQMRNMWKNLTFKEFEKKPRPIWLDPSILTHLCEPFVGVSGSLVRSARIVDFMMEKMLGEERFRRDFSSQELRNLKEAASLMKARRGKPDGEQAESCAGLP